MKPGFKTLLTAALWEARNFGKLKAWAQEDLSRGNSSLARENARRARESWQNLRAFEADLKAMAEN